MSAYFFVSLAFLFAIANRLYLKRALYKLDSYSLALASNVPGILILIPFAWNEFPFLLELTFTQVIFILVTGALWSYVMWVGNITTAFNTFSFQEIIRQTRVLFVVLGGVFILGESLSYNDMIGVSLIVCSVIIISWKHFSFREHITSRALLLTWSVTLIGATIALLEKTIVLHLPVALYTLLAYFLTSFFLILFLNGKRRVTFMHTVYHHTREMFICSLFMLGSYYFGLKAYQLLPISIAYPIIQSSTVIGVLVGTILFEENNNIAKKLIASIVAVAGVLVIKLM